MGACANLKKKTENAAPQGKTAWLPIILCWLAYTSAYLGRYSYNSNITAIMEAYRINHADAGLVTTFFFFAYGAGQIVNGLLCKRYNKRLIISLSLAVSAVLNLVVYCGISFSCIKYLWLANGAVQSVLWSVLVCVMSENLKASDLAKAVVAMSTTVAAGTFFAYGASAVFAMFGGYSLSFLLGAVVMVFVAAAWFLLYKKAFRGEGGEKISAEEENTGTRDSIKTIYFMIAVLGLFAIVNNLVKDGLTTWVPAILKENFGLPDSLSIFLTLFLPILGCFAAVLNAVAEKRVKSFVVLSGIWCFLAAICISVVIFFISTPHWTVVLAAFGLISLFMHSVNNVITNMAPLYMRKRVNSGLVAGLLNGCCYIGSTISSYGLGHVADTLGWNGVFVLLLAVCCVPVLISFLIYVISSLLNRGKSFKII